MVRADTELRYLRGVGPRKGAGLSEQGLVTVEDLLYHLPFRYEDRATFGRIAELRPGGPECTLAARIVASRLIRTRRRGFTIFEARVDDGTGTLRVVWYNQPYLERLLARERRIVLFGRVTLDRGQRPVLESPEYELLDDEDTEGIHAGRIVPVYRKAGDLGSRALRRLAHEALAEIDPASLPPIVPEEIARRYELAPRLAALRATHFPEPGTSLDELARRTTPAQRSLAFEEVFLLQLGLACRRAGLEQQPRRACYEISDELRLRLGRLLPFKLTAAQRRVLREIGRDLRSPHPMNRLLQGDVGSGKTIVALMTLLVAVENGHQAALMAPTEILAEQHFRNIRQLLDPDALDRRLGLLTGSAGAAHRRRVLADLRTGALRLIVGTHALFEPGVEFADLGLVVVDEQHRFGVMQRQALSAKGRRPDVLVMTATPIPRSMALTLYGDLELSVIDELPPGRTPVRTVVREEADRAQVWAGLRGEVGRGRQAYVVVPLVEETEKSDLKAATALAAELRARVFPQFQVGLLHGRMKGPEKDQVMQAFARGELQILVATTVVEVGVDVPNATVMVVEHAERFGLSQLHQLRGRVGRGSDRSFCVLMVGGDGYGHEARERLAVMERTNDGFEIAQKDLELRGPGAVFGTQQHGLSDLQFLTVILRDPELVERARAEARAFAAPIGGQPDDVRRLLAGLGPRWRRRLDLARVG